MSSGDNGSLLKYMFPIAVLGSVLALLFPFILILSSDSPGLTGIPHEDPEILGDSDVFEQAWHFWWVSTALKTGQDPRYCPLVYSPDGASLVYDHIGWHDTLLFALLGIGDEYPGLSHTLSLLLGTLLTAVFGWLLARSWGADRYGALFTALAMAWLPSRTAHLLQHYQIANCWTLPASMWLMREYLRAGHLRVLAGFAAVVLLSSLQSPFFAIFALLALPATCFALQASWKRTGYLASGAAAAVLIAGILLLTSPGDPGTLSSNWREAVYWAAEPQSFMLPSPFGPAGRLLGIPFRLSWMPNTAEGVVTPGLAVITAFVLFAWRKKNWRLPAVCIGFAILALGPELRIFGRPLGIPLPFRIMQFLPVLRGIRAPSRFAIVGGIFMALGAGMGISLLKTKWKLILFAFLIFELWVPVFGKLDTRIPSACATIPSDRTVLELPANSHARRYSWFQTENAYSRRYAFLARLIELPEEVELLREADEYGYVLVYHRWLYNDNERAHYDSVYADLFPGGAFSDSVWISEGGDSP